MPLKDPEARRAYLRQWQASNKDRVAGYCKKWEQANSETSKVYRRQWYLDNKASVNKRNQRNYANNPKAHYASVARRRAAKLLATPSWADLSKIKAFYENCPPGHEVDHIVPLQGVNVRGFHVIDNLQYLLRAENRAKKNTW